jgi:hypothetical protein
MIGSMQLIERSSGDPRVVVALPRGAVNFLGVSPERAGLVGVLGFGSLAGVVAWLIVRAFSIDVEAL